MAPPQDVTLRPLGGLGEVGMNCMAVEAGEDIFVIDCGVKFPDRALGADIIHPDFSWLREHRRRVRAVVLTHGHEDHIGALPYLLRHVPVPVFGPPYALTLAMERIREQQVTGVETVETRPGHAFRIGEVELEPIRVTHSLPDATSLLMRTPVGQVLHTGDFKIDDASPDGAVFDAARFASAGDEGVRLLLSDSTNAWVPGTTGSERIVWDAFADMIPQLPHRVIVGAFASNVHRLIALFDVAARTGRKVCLLGRSMRRHADAAMEHKVLGDVRHLLVTPAQAMALPRGEVLAIATGSQGEARAALGRIARGVFPDFRLESGDHVLLSSRVIPGNELSVHRTVNDLLRLGVDLHLPMERPDLHVSGHAHRDEQRRMLELVRPAAFVPVHGTLFHLQRHAALARECGVPNVFVVENGTSIVVGPHEVRAGATFRTGVVHANGRTEIPDEVLAARSALAEGGLALVLVTVDRRGRVLDPPEVFLEGVVAADDAPAWEEDASVFVERELGAQRGRLRGGRDAEDLAVGALRRFFATRGGQRPVTKAVVTEV